jgi:hypothetical protein
VGGEEKDNRRAYCMWEAKKKTIVGVLRYTVYMTIIKQAFKTTPKTKFFIIHNL